MTAKKIPSAKPRGPLFASALAALAITACASGPLATASASASATASDARVAYVSDSIATGGTAAQSPALPAALPSSAPFATDGAVQIALGAPSSAAGPGVSIGGSTVTITAGGTYSLTGTLTDGQVVVNAPADTDLTVILNGVRISSSTSAALAVMSDSDLTLVLADGTENFLTDAAKYVLPAGADEPNGALFAKGDLTVTGGGALTIDAKFQHGIRGKDDVTIDGGILSITSIGDAVNSNNDLIVNGGRISISAGDDALHADTLLTINDGSINVERSYEGVESEVITINGGTISVTSSNDAINVSAGTTTAATPGVRQAPGTTATGTAGTRMLTINGGYIVLNASNGDGLDSNGSITMTGGTVIVHGAPVNMEAPIDYDATFKITGGTLVAAGSAGMAQAPGTTSTQNSVMVTFPAMQAAGTLVHVARADGAGVLTFAPAKAFQTLVLSSPALELGATYRVSTGGTPAGTAVDGMFSAGAANAGTEFVTFSVAGPVTGAGAAVGRGARR
jgi:hypothetical protein